MSDLFTRALLRSKTAVRAMADHLNSKGFPVVTYPTFVRPSVELRDEYLDSGDLYLCLRMEVKHRSCQFTCRDDYPYQMFMIERKAKHDSARPKPIGYYIVNGALTHYGYVAVRTQPNWIVKEISDGRPGRCATDEMYFCETKLVEFGAL